MNTRERMYGEARRQASARLRTDADRAAEFDEHVAQAVQLATPQTPAGAPDSRPPTSASHQPVICGKRLHKGCGCVRPPGHEGPCNCLRRVP